MNKSGLLFGCKRLAAIGEVNMGEDVEIDEVARAYSLCHKISRKGNELRDEEVVVEAPAVLTVNGACSLRFTCSPKDLVDLAYGIVFTNGIISSADDVSSVTVSRRDSWWCIDMHLMEGKCVDPLALTVSGVVSDSREGCALELPEFPAILDPLPDAEPIPPEAIWTASERLLEHQCMHSLTGATHAAAFVTRGGEFLYVREDVSRHNGVDKLIGALVRDGVDPHAGFFFLSSRCALELVSRAARFGVVLVAAVSAPTTAVIDFANKTGVTLCGFSRQGRFTVYSHPERLASSGVHVL